MNVYICVYEAIGLSLLFYPLRERERENFLSFFLFLAGPKELKEFIVFPLATGSGRPSVN